MYAHGVGTLGAWVRRNIFRVRFNYESPAYSLLIKGMFGQQPEGRGAGGRTEALEIPGVLRGRNLICSISTLPLEAYAVADNRIVDHPLLRQIDPNVANVVTLAQSIEDLLFDGVCWWRITRFSSADGYPYSAVRYAPSQVSLTAPKDYQHGYLPSDLPTNGVIWMGGEEVPFDQVIRFDSPNPGLLSTIRRTLLRALALDLAARNYSENPRPADFFSPSDPNSDPLADEDGPEKVQQLLDDWKSARQRSTTAYIPSSLKYTAVQQPTPAELQLAQLQERVSIDIANAMGLEPEMLGVSTTSRTYANVVDRRKDRINDVYQPYMSAITERLSMPDVTKRGIKVRFNLDSYLKADPKTRAEVEAIYLDKGVVSRAEVRAAEGWAGPPPQLEQERRPAIDAGVAIIEPRSAAEVGDRPWPSERMDA